MVVLQTATWAVVPSLRPEGGGLGVEEGGRRVRDK